MNNTQRAAVVAKAELMIAQAAFIDYDMERPFPILTTSDLKALNATKKVAFDCSASVVNAFQGSGAHDPSGFNYSGNGNTETMMTFLSNHYTDVVAAHPAALIVFNADGPLAQQHVCLVLAQGLNPWLMSHGSDAGPIKIRYSAELAVHPGRICCLNVSHD